MSSSPPEFEARQLSLPKPLLHTPFPQISSILYDPLSDSLALRHSDSSFSLYPSFSPLSLSPYSPNSHSHVPCPTSSATFLRLQSPPNSTATTLFLASSPLLRPSSCTLLCFYVLRDDRFVRIKVTSNHRDLVFDRSKFGVLFKVNHGVSVKLSGGINVFSMYSVSSSKIWVFAVRLIKDEEGGEALKLMKCAVIDCSLPVFTIRILFGFLFLGEENGVRVFPLQALVKGNHRKEKKNSNRRSNLRDGSGSKTTGMDGDLNLFSVKGEKSEKQPDSGELVSLLMCFHYFVFNA